jgi:xylulokinase
VAADMLEWFRKHFGTEETARARAEGGVDWDHLMALARQAPAGAGGVMFLPHMSGCTLPVVDPHSCGAFVGLRNQAGKGHLLRAMIEGLSYQFLQMVAGLRSALRVTPDKFVAVGGGAQNAFWTQTKADMVGKPFEAPAVEEATPLGAAILAGIGVGLYRDEAEAFARVYRPGRVMEPDLRLTAQYAEGFALFQRLHPALKDVHAELSTTKHLATA